MRRLPGLAVVACAVALSGCGDDGSGGPLSKSEYEQRFREIIREGGESAPGSEASPQTPREQAEEIDAGLDRMRATANELAELEPPSEVARAHTTFVRGLRALANDGEKIVRALRAGDEQRAEAILDSGALASSPAARKIPSARREFAAKGYELGGVSDFP